MLNTLKLSAALALLTLALASCGGGTTGTVTPDPVAVIDDQADDTFSDDDGGEVTAEKTIPLSMAQVQSLRPLVSSAGPTSNPGPVTVTATILRATSGKYAGQVKGKLVLTYSGTVAYKGDFALKLGTGTDAANAFLISKRKNDSKDSSYVVLKPTKGKPSTIKNLTMQYAPALNGTACMYLSYDLKDNGGAGPDEIAYNNTAPLLCEPDGSAQTDVKAALLTASTGYLYGAQPWQTVTVSGPAAPAATLAGLPADLSGTPKTDFEAWFAPLMTAPAPVDPLKPTQAELSAKQKAAQAKSLHDSYLKLFKAAQLGVYVTPTETFVVGVNSWGVVGLKATIPAPSAPVAN